MFLLLPFFLLLDWSNILSLFYPFAWKYIILDSVLGTTLEITTCILDLSSSSVIWYIYLILINSSTMCMPRLCILTLHILFCTIHINLDLSNIGLCCGFFVFLHLWTSICYYLFSAWRIPFMFPFSVFFWLSFLNYMFLGLE